MSHVRLLRPFLVRATSADYNGRTTQVDAWMAATAAFLYWPTKAML